MEKAHSSNIIIHGSSDFHINNNLNKDSGLHILRLGVSLGAIHDSAERYPPPNCHPDTRKAVRQIILDWIHDESSGSFFWLYGSAGAGKTAILQAIAEYLYSPSGSDQNFGGSFFFSRGKKGRDEGHFLFSTIAYQLALKVPGLRQHVNFIMELNPTLHTKSMDVQLQSLIVDAFRNLSPLPQRSYLVIIDGLDECHDKATQQSILRLLCEMITVHGLPLRFLIGSRRESHIRDSFDQESLCTVTQRLVLDETFNPGGDIRVFLRDGFAKICAKNSILSHVEQPWPGEGIIDLLVQRSSGQFIYAATVLKFVGADFCSPTRQLALVLKTDPTAFSDLDQLYYQILSVYPSAVNIVQVLGIISASHGDLAEVIEDIFGMEEGELKLVLRGLSSLMNDENDENEGVISEPYVIPHFAYASFSVYLFDSSRSGPFHVDQQEYESQITIQSFALIMQSIRSWRPFHPFYKLVKEAIMADIDDLVGEFWASSDGAIGASIFAMRRLFDVLQQCLDTLKISESANSNSWHRSAQSDADDRIRAKFETLFDGYRKMLDQSFTKSEDLAEMLRFLPGVVVQNHMSMQGMADLYRIKSDLLERLIKSTIEPLRLSDAHPRYILDGYLSGFLQDRDRSQLYYCDPMFQHVSICRHFLSLLDGSNAFNFQSHDLSDYISSHFYDHLCAATTAFLHPEIIFDDHPAAIPALEILHDLETTAYYVDENLSCQNRDLMRCIIQTILRWANMPNRPLKCVAVSVSNVFLMERVCHLTNKIYREMLCIKRHEGMSYMTVHGLDRVPGAFSRTLQYRIVLSWDLLNWITTAGGIPCSFTKFITTLELSGPLYISPDIYHTQITEYSLETFYQHSIGYCFLSLDWSFREHLSCALPTEMIFYILRSIRSEYLIRDYSIESMLDMLKIIIKWLQGLGSERPSDLYTRFQGELFQLHQPSSSLLVPPQQLLGTTCWIAAEHALQHARNNISSVSKVFDKWQIQESEYVVQAGFDESLIKSHVGYLEQIHVIVFTELEVDTTSPLLSELGRLFSPFSSILFTVSYSYRLPVFKNNGNVWEFDELTYFTASKFADDGSSAKTPLTIISLSQTSCLADGMTGSSQSTGSSTGSGDSEGEKNKKWRLEKGKERDMGDKDEADKGSNDPSDEPDDSPGDEDGTTRPTKISFEIASEILPIQDEWNTFQTLTMHGSLTIKTTPLTQNPPQFSERFVQFTELTFDTRPPTDFAYNQIHLRVVVDSQQENAHVKVIKPRRTSDSDGEEKQSSSTKSGLTRGGTAGVTLGPHPQVAITGNAMKTNEETAGSEKKRYNSAITEHHSDGNVQWGFNIDDANLRKWGIDMREDVLPTVSFEFVGDSDEPAPPPKLMDIAITSYWSMTLPPSEPKNTWIHKLLRLFRSTGNTPSYSNLFQVVALKADLSKLPKPSRYRATVKVRSGVSDLPDVKRRAADSVYVTPLVVDDPRRLSAFDLPKIAKFRISDNCFPIMGNLVCDSTSKNH